MSDSNETETSPAIAVRNLRKEYRLWRQPSSRLIAPLLSAIGLKDRAESIAPRFEALKGIDLTIGRGECVGIIGRNGSGKSTFLQLLAGVLQPTSGELEIEGRVAALLELGAGFNPEFSGRENVFLNASLHGVSRQEIRSRFDEIEAFADIGDFIDQPIKTYSSGMVIRLAFATQVLLDPDILLIDEALSVGDIFFQQKCFRFLRENFAEHTRVLVTHDMHALSSLAPRVIVLNRGELIFDGPTREGISLYTKLSHDEHYTAKRKVARNPEPSLRSSAAMEELPWRDPTSEQISGQGEAWIRRIAFCDADRQEANLVEPHDPLTIHAEIEVKRAPMAAIVGYFLRDPRGNDIAGDTHLPLLDGPAAIAEPGTYYLRIRLKWPFLRPGEYTLTIGIGEGDHPFNHHIQCWVQNAFRVTAISPNYAVHNWIAHPMESFLIEPWPRN